jgi:hypothetical protein
MHGFPLDGAANSRISSTPIRSLARIQKGDRQATRKEGKREKKERRYRTEYSLVLRGIAKRAAERGSCSH